MRPVTPSAPPRVADGATSPLGSAGPPDDTRPAFSFPHADLVHAAAAAFPAVDDGRFRFGYTPSNSRGDLSVESVDAAEGVYARVHVAPGFIRVSRVNHAAALRTRDRASLARQSARSAAVASARLHAFDVPRDGEQGGYVERVQRTSRRGAITSWSAKSRAALVRKIASLDLNPVVSGPTPPAMVTLTLPGDWLAVAPDGDRAAALFDAWTRAYARRWRVELQGIWKREFQHRGAPHWHVWMCLPTRDVDEFRSWLARSWASVVGASSVPDARGASLGFPVHLETACSCSEFCRHLRAGTGVDFSEGRRARDPRRLAVYFLKESGNVSGKAYQNRVPRQWTVGTAGRFWGVRGLSSVVATAPLSAAHAVKLWRVVAKILESRRPARFTTISAWGPDGTRARSRPVRRRVRENVTRQRAGWVLVNDGPSAAWSLASWLSTV